MRVSIFSFILLYIFAFCLPTNTQAQALTVYLPSTASTSKPSYISMIRSLFGTGIKVLAVRVSGDTTGTSTSLVQMGWFNATGSGLSLTKGFLMTNGLLSNAVGPNNSTGISGTYYNPPNMNGDIEITNRFGVTVTPFYPAAFSLDAASIEVDFAPYWDSLTIKYVFASEEYPIFSPSIFPTNDGFALLLKEMGTNAAWQNIALLSNGAPVCVRNVNSVTNAGSYLNNSGNNFQYDGYTRVLRAKAALSPCKSYTLKFVIGDINDSGRDSGVFIEEGGIGTNIPFRTPPPYTAQLVHKVINISGGRFSDINTGSPRTAHTVLNLSDTLKWYRNSYITGEKGIGALEKTSVI